MINRITRWPFYPFLISMLAIFGIYAVNMDEVKLSEIFKPLFITLLFTLLLTLLFYKQWKQWGILLSAILIAIMISPYLIQYNHVAGPALLATFLLLALRLILRKPRKQFLIKTTPFLNLICLTLLLPSLARIALHTEYLQPNKSILTPVSLPTENQPDIYCIIIDRYARSDILQQNFDLDNSAFLTSLRSQGFYIADQSYSNYNSTATSLYALLNMEYVPTFRSYSPVYDGLQKTRVSMSLKQSGYTLIRMGSWWAPTSHSLYADINYNLTTPEDFSEVVWDLTLAKGPIRLFRTLQGREYSLYASANYKFEKLTTISPFPEPTFTFAHFLTCHSPYIYNADGTPNYRPGEPPGAYQDGITHTNARLLQFLESIPRDAIVIIQADHGPASTEILPNGWGQKEYIQQYAILNAIRIPNSYTMSSPLYPSISPVNTFRVLFNAIFQTQLDLLPDESCQWTPGSPSRKMEEIP